MTDGAVPHQFNVPAAALAFVPGVVLTAVGVHLLITDSLDWLGAVLLALGAGFLLIGGVAKGVSWGIALERQDRME